MFGTWQPTRPASSPTESSPPARDSRTHRRLGSPRARATAAERCRSSSVAGAVVSITSSSLSLVAQRRKSFGLRDAPRRRILGGMTVPTDPSRPRRHRGDARAPRRPRPPHADALVGDGGAGSPPRPAAALADGPAVPQGRAPPEDRLVQGARGAGADRVPDGRRAGARRDHDVGRQRGPGLRVGGPRGRRPGDRRDAVDAVALEGRRRAASYGAEVVLDGAHVGEALERLERLRDERGLVFVHPFDDPEVLRGPRIVRPRDPRGPARRRRRRRRRRWRRADRRGRRSRSRSRGRGSASTASSRPDPRR